MYLFFFLTLLASLFLFRISFHTYFFQDDYFVLSISQVHSINEILRFFIPRADVQFYRPLSLEIFYLLSRLFFGLNPFMYHLMIFLVFCFNVFLVFKVSKKIIDSEKMSKIVMLLFATSAIHYNSLFWIANCSYIFVTFFYLLTFYIVLSATSRFRKWILVIIVYLLGLFTNEIMITFPALIFLYLILLEAKKIRSHLFLCLYLSFITLIYLIFRFMIFHPNIKEYPYIIGPNILQAYRWFFFFFQNWAETMKDQMLTLFTVRDDFKNKFGSIYNIYIVSTLYFSLLTLISIVSTLWKRGIFLKKIRLLIFLMLWTTISLLPVVFVPGHFSPHQGSIAIVGFLLILCYFVYFKKLSAQKYSSLLLYLFLILWLVSSAQTIELNNKVHWVVRRSKIAKSWIEKAKSRYNSFDDNDTIVLATDEKEVKVALGEGEALRVIYNNPSLNVIFSADPVLLNNFKVVP